LGYSGVVFGLEAIMSSKMDALTLGGITIPWSITPFLNLALTQLLVPNASFVGHLAGIVAGFLITWHAFDWVTPVF
jgi:membrane associated rhomboid family serine protease